MAKHISEDIFKRNWVMDRAWARDNEGNLIEGEALILAMLLKVKKDKRGRTDEQVAELEEIMKPRRRKKR